MLTACSVLWTDLAFTLPGFFENSAAAHSRGHPLQCGGWPHRHLHRCGLASLCLYAINLCRLSDLLTKRMELNIFEIVRAMRESRNFMVQSLAQSSHFSFPFILSLCAALILTTHGLILVVRNALIHLGPNSRAVCLHSHHAATHDRRSSAFPLSNQCGFGVVVFVVFLVCYVIILNLTISDCCQSGLK